MQVQLVAEYKVKGKKSHLSAAKPLNPTDLRLMLDTWNGLQYARLE